MMCWKLRKSDKISQVGVRFVIAALLVLPLYEKMFSKH